MRGDLDGAWGLPRREFLRRGAIAGGTVAGLLAAPKAIRDAYGAPIPIPPDRRP